MINVLVLCTGNSCRSIIGEALFNHLNTDINPEKVRAFSAGSHPTGTVNKNALLTLKNHGINTNGYTSNSWDDFVDQKIDVVITVCDNAASEVCPVYLKSAIKLHWGLPDPANISGSQQEVENAFEYTYFQLEKKIKKMLDLPLSTLSDQEFTKALASI